MNDATRWHLLRHAPADVPKGMIYGRTNVRAAAQDPALMAEIAARLPKDATLITTPLRRTHETAEMLSAAGWEPRDSIEEPALVEQHFGDWEQNTHEALGQSEDADYIAFWKDPARNRPPGGESFIDVLDRVVEAFMALTEICHGRDVVFVGHGGPIRAILAMALDLTPERALSLDIAPLSLSLVDYLDMQGKLPPWRVRGINLPPATPPLP